MPKGFRFWLVFAALTLSVFAAILESVAVSNALPTIIADLHANEFLWVASAYGLASSAFLPLSGGLAEIFGRRHIMLVILSLFIIGSILAGAAQNMTMLIAARTLQGAGGGGIFGLTQIILSDLVSLEERGTYNGIFGLAWAIGGGIGPLVGGALAHHTTWRWLFYLNVPIAGVAWVLIALFLTLPIPPSSTKEKLAQIDLIGNSLVIGSTCACVIALTWAGTTYPWISVQVLLPLIVGVIGLFIFMIYETKWAHHPIVPIQLLSNRTSVSGYLQISICSVIIVSLLYYLPVYYQACKGFSPIASGVDLFGLAFTTAPTSVLIGASVQITKRYRPQIWIGWCLIIVGLGLMSTITIDTSRAKSIGYQVIAGTGMGAIYTSVYFPVLAPLPVTANAHALSFFVFLRTLLQVWGVTLGGTILQNGLSNRLPNSFSTQISGDIAYSSIPLISGLPQPTQGIVREAFATSLTTLWRVLIGFAGAGLLVSFFMKGLPLHTEKDEKWALQDGKKQMEKATTSDSTIV